jgi:hypothetical protein
MSTIPAPGIAAEATRDKAKTTTDDELVPRWAEMLLGLFLLLLGLVLISFVIALWPAVQAAASDATSKPIHWFGWKYKPTPDAALLILVILVSALGSYVHTAISFTDYVGEGKLKRSWIWWYVLRLFVGTSLAVIFYFAIRGGFFAGSTNSEDINPYGIAAVAGLVGLFSKQATDKLNEVFDTAFRTSDKYGDSVRGGKLKDDPPGSGPGTATTTSNPSTPADT